jgi:hypothetical protein
MHNFVLFDNSFQMKVIANTGNLGQAWKSILFKFMKKDPTFGLFDTHALELTLEQYHVVLSSTGYDRWLFLQTIIPSFSYCSETDITSAKITYADFFNILAELKWKIVNLGRNVFRPPNSFCSWEFHLIPVLMKLKQPYLTLIHATNNKGSYRTDKIKCETNIIDIDDWDDSESAGFRCKRSTLISDILTINYK